MLGPSRAGSVQIAHILGVTIPQPFELVAGASALGQQIAPFKDGAVFGPISEHVIQGFYASLLSPGDVSVDVGVHYGIHLFPMAAAVGASGRVIGVEANEERFTVISREAAKRGLTQVELKNCAASNVDGTVVFNINVLNDGYSGIIEKRRSDDDYFDKVEVSCHTLDKLLADVRNIRFIKIDVEGAEGLVILGASGVIARERPVIVFEGTLSETAEKTGHSVAEIAAAFPDYEISDLFGQEVDFQDRSGAGWNFVAYPKERRPQVAEGLRSAWDYALRAQA